MAGDRVAMACLAQDPDDRWQSARDLLREVKWLTESGASTSHTTASPRSAPGYQLVWVVAMVTIITASIAVAMMPYFPPRPEPSVWQMEIVTAPTSDPVLALT